MALRPGNAGVVRSPVRGPSRSWVVPFVLAALLLVAGCIPVEPPAPAAPPPVAGTPAPATPPLPVALPGAPLSFAGVVAGVMPSVVFVRTQLATATGRSRTAAGSGVIMRSDGYVLTNKHVVDGYRRVDVTLQDRSVYEARSIWMDDVLDLAAVKIDAQGLAAARFADTSGLRLGDWVIALGHPLGVSPDDGGAAVTAGIVSNLDRSFQIGDVPYYDVIQTDAAINPGNSGGPLVNLNGEVVGINSAGAGQAQNIGFAVNVSTARRVFEDLVQNGRVLRPYLGATLGDLTPEATCEVCLSRRIGTVIVSLEAGGPAQRAGLQQNDVIVRLGSAEIVSTTQMIRDLWRLGAGDTVSIGFYRADQLREVSLTLGECPG